MLGFLIWLSGGVLMSGYGIYAFCSKRAVTFGFWANADMFEVTNVKRYNQAVGKLWCVFGVVFVLLGIPLLSGQNSPYVMISILGAMAEAIAAMAVYTTVIEKKYKK